MWLTVQVFSGSCEDGKDSDSLFNINYWDTYGKTIKKNKKMEKNKKQKHHKTFKM